MNDIEILIRVMILVKVYRMKCIAQNWLIIWYDLIWYDMIWYDMIYDVIFHRGCCIKLLHVPLCYLILECFVFYYYYISFSHFLNIFSTSTFTTINLTGNRSVKPRSLVNTSIPGILSTLQVSLLISKFTKKY